MAKILNVSCDYLLLEDHAGNTDQSEKVPSSITRLLGNLIGKRVKLNFYDEEEDYDLLLKECLVKGFEGNWVQVEASSAKENIQKLIPVSSILSVEILSDL